MTAMRETCCLRQAIIVVPRLVAPLAYRLPCDVSSFNFLRYWSYFCALAAAR